MENDNPITLTQFENIFDYPSHWQDRIEKQKQTLSVKDNLNEPQISNEKPDIAANAANNEPDSSHASFGRIHLSNDVETLQDQLTMLKGNLRDMADYLKLRKKTAPQSEPKQQIEQPENIDIFARNTHGQANEFSRDLVETTEFLLDDQGNELTEYIHD